MCAKLLDGSMVLCASMLRPELYQPGAVAVDVPETEV